METPINNKNLFPKIEKNVSTNDVMTKTSNDNFKFFWSLNQLLKSQKVVLVKRGL